MPRLFWINLIAARIRVPSHSLTISFQVSFDLPGSLMNIPNFLWKVEESSIFLLGFLKQTEQSQNIHKLLTFHCHKETPRSPAVLKPLGAYLKVSLRALSSSSILKQFSRKYFFKERRGSELETNNSILQCTAIAASTTEHKRHLYW